MSSSLVEHLTKNKTENNPFPATDGSAGIVYNKADGDILSFTIDSVECVDSPDKKNIDITTGIALPVKKQWTICVTDTRITFWCPWSRGFLGLKTQQKPGNALGGHLYYDGMASLNADFTYKSLLSVGFSCLRYDRTQSVIVLRSDDGGVLKNILTAVYERSTEHLKTAGIYGNTAGADFISDWELFHTFDWTGKRAFILPKTRHQAVASYKGQPTYDKWIISGG